MKRLLILLLFLLIAAPVSFAGEKKKDKGFELFAADDWANMRKLLETAIKTKDTIEKLAACMAYAKNYGNRTIHFVSEAKQVKEEKDRVKVYFKIFTENVGWWYSVAKDKAPGEFTAKSGDTPGTKAVLKGTLPKDPSSQNAVATVIDFRRTVKFVKIYDPKTDGKEPDKDSKAGKDKDGKKKLPEGACEKCRGSGKKDCSACEGTGRKRCWNCKGDGLVKCSKCDGRGAVQRFGGGVDRCPKCCSRKKCRFCTGAHPKGRLHCSKCLKDRKGRPTGKKECTTCKSTGKRKCVKCKGTGKVK
ncbi:MAG: hypothetical protein E3J72_04040 [Planctomycetota bacterium]|nr:MAG: hypothetical protein E3J72_04040 [Planctomycetota bacterium]